jgi:hypothetical protein
VSSVDSDADAPEHDTTPEPPKQPLTKAEIDFDVDIGAAFVSMVCAYAAIHSCHCATVPLFSGRSSRVLASDVVCLFVCL